MITYFGINGYTVSIPLNDTQWYDLIVEKDDIIQTVQCKFTASKNKQIDLRSTGGTNGSVYDTVTNHPVTSISPILSLCSSVGSPSSDWLKSILSSCNGGKEIPKTTPITDLFHLVFPTNAYVSNSRIGTDMAGSLILKRTSYMRSTFPKKSLKRYKDCKGRENSLPHAKYSRIVFIV